MNSQRTARQPFYPVVQHIEKRIAREFDDTRRLIARIGMVVIALLIVIAAALIKSILR